MSSTESKKQQRQARQAKREAERKAQKRKDRLQLLLGGLVLLAALAGIVWSVASGDDPVSEKTETASPEITGETLPALNPNDPASDPAIGTPAPEVEGVNFDDEPVTLRQEGEATIAVFVAHWCPVCNREVPVLVDEFDPETLPEGVRMVAVSTAVRPGQPNYPPSQWLESRDWDFPVLVDSEDSAITRSFGIPAYPGFVAIGADGNVIARTTGELPASQVQALIDAAAATV